MIWKYLGHVKSRKLCRITRSWRRLTKEAQLLTVNFAETPTTSTETIIPLSLSVQLLSSQKIPLLEPQNKEKQMLLNKNNSHSAQVDEPENYSIDSIFQTRITQINLQEKKTPSRWRIQLLIISGPTKQSRANC